MTKQISSNDDDKLSDLDWETIRKQRPVRLKISRQSLYWFFHLYFGHYIKYPTAAFQKELMELASDPTIEHLIVVAFRESGKSTIMTTAFPLWAITGQLQKKYVVIVSQTQTQAQQHLANIARELETNELMRKDFWPYDYEEIEPGVSAIKLPKFSARIIAVSSDQGLRGLRSGPHRPDLIISDDIEDSRKVPNRDTRNRTFQWFTSELLTLGSDNTKYITIGNLLHEDSLLMRLKAGIENGKRDGVYREYPLDRDGVPLWPDRFPDKASLQRAEQRIGDYVQFEREYRLRLVPDEEQVITRDMIHHYPELPALHRGEHRRLVVGVDLAISEKNAADYTAIVTLDIRGHGDDMRIYVLPQPVNKRLGFPATIDLVKEMDVALQGPQFYVESTAYQEAVVQALQRDTVAVKGVKPNSDKRTRLNMIADKIQRGVILFPQRGCDELITQLVGFGIEKHDDLADALTMAVIEAMRDAKSESRIWFGTHNLYGGSRGGSSRRRSDRNYWNRRLDDFDEATSGDWD